MKDVDQQIKDGLCYQVFHQEALVTETITVVDLLKVINEMSVRLDKMLQLQMKADVLTYHPDPHLGKSMVSVTNSTITGLRYQTHTWEWVGLTYHKITMRLYVYFK